MKQGVLKRSLCIMLCILIMCLTMVVQHQQVQAFLPALALTPAAINTIASLLYAAGVSYMVYDCVDDAVKWWYSESGYNTRRMMIDAANTVANGVVDVSTDLWNAARSWVQSKYQVGTHSQTVSYYLHENAPITVQGQANKSLGTVVQLGQDTYWLQKIGDMVSGTPPVVVGGQYAIYKNGVKLTSYNFSTGQFNQFSTEEPYFVLYLSSSNVLTLDVCYYYNYTTQSRASTLTISNSFPVPAPKSISYVGADVLTNPTYDFQDEQGRRKIAVPVSLDDLIGKTYTDVQNPTETTTDPGTTAPDMTSTNSILDSILGALTGGISTTLGNIWDWLQDFFGSLPDVITGALTGITSKVVDIYNAVNARCAEIVDSLAGIRSEVQQEDLEGKTRSFKLLDLFFGFFEIIFSCIRLVLRACLFLGTIVAIPPDSSLLNSDAISGIDFFKNQNIPVLNITVWTLFSGFMALIISLGVVKKVRTTHT